MSHSNPGHADAFPKVLLATHFPIPHIGGASTHIELLARELSQRQRLVGLVSGIHQHVIRRTVCRVRRRLLGDLGRVLDLKAAVSSLAARLASSARVCSRPLVVHCHDPIAACAALRCRQSINDFRIVQTVHGPWLKEALSAGLDPKGTYALAIAALERESFERADHIIAVDKGQADIVLLEFGIKHDRVSCIPNALDFDGLPLFAQPPPLPRRAILVARRLVPKNGVEFAIRAMPRLADLDLVLAIAGDGPLRSELEQLSSALGVSERVSFLGDVGRERLLGLVGTCAVSVVPSVPHFGVVEATSLSALEALGMGAPLVASGIGGLVDIAGDGIGWLVAPGDPAALANAIRSVVSLSEEQRAARVRSAREFGRSHFGLASWMRAIEGTYNH